VNRREWVAEWAQRDPWMLLPPEVVLCESWNGDQVTVTIEPLKIVAIQGRPFPYPRSVMLGVSA
jgi:hypothetical protein